MFIVTEYAALTLILLINFCPGIIQLLYCVFVPLALHTIIKCFDLIVVFSSHVHLYFLVSLFADKLLSTNFVSHHSKGEGKQEMSQ